MIPSCVGSNPTSPAINYMSYDSLTIFTGNANLKLASSVAKHLNLPLGKANVGRFSDGEIMVELLKMLEEKMRLFYSQFVLLLVKI